MKKMFGLESLSMTVDVLHCRITSYNVCYTKLLRAGAGLVMIETQSEKVAAQVNTNEQVPLGRPRAPRAERSEEAQLQQVETRK